MPDSQAPAAPHRPQSPTRLHVVPLSLLFPCIFAAVYLLHLPLMRLPYYWDEGGYYIPAAWDFWRLGTVIPVSTVRNAHPPLPSILLAGWWDITGFHIYSTRLLMCLVTSVALLGVYRLARGLTGQAAALAVTGLTAIYSVWFAQSTLAHADMFAAAATVWALVFYFDQVSDGISGTRAGWHRPLLMALCFSLAVLSKETAIVMPASLFLLEAYRWWQARLDRSTVPVIRAQVWLMGGLAIPALPLAAWYGYHRVKTGFTFGNPEYLRYNATANLSVTRVLLSLWHRLVHLTVHMNLFVPALLTLATLGLPALAGRRRLPRAVVVSLTVIIVANWAAFSILGGALLTRYLLPVYPLLLLLCVSEWRLRVSKWAVLVAVTLVAFAAACLVNPPYPFAPEDNLAYADMIRLQQEAIQHVVERSPSATVLSAWPVTADLQRPELGYVAKPMKTAEIENFTREEILKAAQELGDFDTAIVFSTKYNPPPGGLNWAARTSVADSRYFDAHRDLLPAEIAHALGGSVAWQAESHGQWAAVLRFQRRYDARLGTEFQPVQP